MGRRKSGGTREKLLSAASDVFVDKGFRDATVAEICRRAGANISAVNYYFGSKEALYQEAWRHSFSASIRSHPPDGGVSTDAPAAERLRGQVRALIARIADRDNRDFFISQMEFINPTGLLAEVMESELIPLRRKTIALMHDLLGPEIPIQQVAFCETCIISMCIHPILMQKIRRETEGPDIVNDLEAFTNHVLTFALAGIAAIKSADPASGPALRDGAAAATTAW